MEITVISNLNVVYVLLLYKHLLIVVCMLFVYHAFYLSEAGIARSHLLAAWEGFSLVVGRTGVIVGILLLIYLFSLDIPLEEWSKVLLV